MTVRTAFLALTLLVAAGSPSVGVAQDGVATGAGAPPASAPASPTMEGQKGPKSDQTDETPPNPPGDSPALFSTYIFQDGYIKCAKQFGISRAKAIERYKHNVAVSANMAKSNDFKTSMEIDEEHRVSEEEVDSAASGCGYIHKEYY